MRRLFSRLCMKPDQFRLGLSTSAFVTHLRFFLFLAGLELSLNRLFLPLCRQALGLVRPDGFLAECDFIQPLKLNGKRDFHGIFFSQSMHTFDFVPSLVNIVALLLDAHGRCGQLGPGRLDRLHCRLLPRRRIAVRFLPVNQFVLFGVRDERHPTNNNSRPIFQEYLTLLDSLCVVQLALIRLLFLC